MRASWTDEKEFMSTWMDIYSFWDVHTNEESVLSS